MPRRQLYEVSSFQRLSNEDSYPLRQSTAVHNKITGSSDAQTAIPRDLKAHSPMPIQGIRLMRDWEVQSSVIRT